jgi:hypothetical protein
MVARRTIVTHLPGLLREVAMQHITIVHSPYSLYHAVANGHCTTITDIQSGSHRVDYDSCQATDTQWDLHNVLAMHDLMTMD